MKDINIGDKQGYVARKLGERLQVELKLLSAELLKDHPDLLEVINEAERKMSLAIKSQ